MLWFPTKQTQKTVARIKRKRHMRRMARLLLFLFVFFGLTTAAAPPSQALLVRVDTVTTPYQFDFVDWMSNAIASEIGRRWRTPPLPGREVEQKALVQRFLDQEQHSRDLKQELNRIYAANSDLNGVEAAALEKELAGLKATQAQIIPLVETILSRQVETILREEGFTIANQVFPPVAFRFIDPPTALILSPRDRIENRYFVGLQPGLDNKLRFEIEDSIDRRGDVSSYVTDVGGLASYPTMIISHPDLIYLTEVIAHEWAHNYFFTFPTNMAWGYQSYPRLTTINETTADIIGKEISRKVITRFYPDWTDKLPPLDDTGQPVPARPSEFHLAMRRIRLEVNRLLAEGKIEEAEAFMENERLKLVEKGHNLRKLNQAYFAFHGSYALSPASVDPIGPQLRQLRAISLSLKAFVDRVGWLNSYADYLNWLAEVGLE
ncbi:MAG: hypothetical protein JXM69_10635 [Anaerolineae bacterium]|nr:hypothetical protein [Anaerolineae bacterium]